MREAGGRPEQDPVDGSREAIERDLKRQKKQHDEKESEGRDVPDTSSPGAEAAEPSPGS